MKYPSPRKTVHYPRSSKLGEYLDAKTKENPNTPLWMHLEKAIEKLPKSKEEQDVAAYNECVEKLAGSDPELRNKFGILAKYVMRQLLGIELVIFEGNRKSEWRRTGRKQLDDSYFDQLKKL